MNLNANGKTLLRLWEKHHKNYQNIIDDYNKVCDEAREKGVSRRRLSEKRIREEFPEIPILRETTEEGAISLIEKLDTIEINKNIAEIEALDHECYIYVTLKSHIYDLRYKIDHANMDKTKYRLGMKPEARR